MSGNVFKNKIRVRANGILQQEGALLLIQIKSPVINELVWMPPGGGLQFGESMVACLKREFREETGLEIKVGSLSFVNELVEPPFHAVECYFKVEQTGGDLKVGHDPELDEDEQLIKDLQWVSFNELSNINVIPDQLGKRFKVSSSHKLPGFYS